MAKFDWTARDKAGRNLSGTLDAPAKDAVVSKLHALGLIVMTVDEARSARSGTVDFAARLEAHSTSAGTIDYSARLQPPQAAKAQPFATVVVAAVLAGVGVAIVRAAGWPPPMVPGIIAAVFLLLSIALLATLAIGLLMPARMAAAVDALKRQAEKSRRQR